MSEEVKNYIENTDFNKYKLVVDREYKEQYIQGLEQENKQLKEVIEEVREYIEKNLSFCENDSQGAYEVCAIRIASDKKLLQILDKVKEVGNE